MKTRCDNECTTCPINQQALCALSVAKANNRFCEVIVERLDSIENFCKNIESVLTFTPTITTSLEKPKKEKIDAKSKEE